VKSIRCRAGVSARWLALALAACGPGTDGTAAISEQEPEPPAAEGMPPAAEGVPPIEVPGTVPPIAASTVVPERGPNELGRIPILEYHLFGDTEGRWQRTPARFRQDLELLHARGYRPITVGDLIDGRIDLPAGLSPVVITFDDASPGQFRYLEQGDSLAIDPESAVGIWLDMNRRHPEWENKGVFCLLSGAEVGRAFFGDKGIEGQATAWRHRKVKQLAELGFELCNHTLWHANLAKMDGARVQEQIARLLLAIDSAVPDYRVRTFALPLGQWPEDRALATHGQWTDPRSGRTTAYSHDAVLLVAGGPTRSPHDPEFDPLRLTRVQVFEDELVTVLDRLDATGNRYVSDGDPARVTAPAKAAADDV
jgi:peptidoglycan/xylan/chitin deacetylase (PgdA/CDA1 family)